MSLENRRFVVLAEFQESNFTGLVLDAYSTKVSMVAEGVLLVMRHRYALVDADLAGPHTRTCYGHVCQRQAVLEVRVLVHRRRSCFLLRALRNLCLCESDTLRHCRYCLNGVAKTSSVDICPPLLSPLKIIDNSTIPFPETFKADAHSLERFQFILHKIAFISGLSLLIAEVNSYSITT